MIPPTVEPYRVTLVAGHAGALAARVTEPEGAPCDTVLVGDADSSVDAPVLDALAGRGWESLDPDPVDVAWPVQPRWLCPACDRPLVADARGALGHLPGDHCFAPLDPGDVVHVAVLLVDPGAPS